ncbi:Nucleolar complex protein 4 homolog B-like Protein [Tribolium castaneum]|uniref:Nucleolar complex protein 4 homolog B-like Protein n=1 Tax=Tribolium castaneum TaxID=7070 RepID=D6X118_TRICA|nr:PREDICTED: nucleolar complex protein 4 homolog B [Tribolium castaneum]EFA09396.1 Nucleolar complex protein 4 homolog B-like Protein [Tribolium castaneum]|eukprot:XP_015838584.1 PREDICTED: nucleolar complex protein 4 homolog B [Tribolium castaneum]
MSNQEKPVKISKQLRLKAHEFLSSRKNSEHLLSIVRHFESGADLSSCLLTLELIFTNLLKDRDMYIEVVPLKPIEKTETNQYKEWLRNLYENCFSKILESFENDSNKIQIQGLSTAMNIISYEGKFPLENRGNLECYVPLNRLKPVLMKLLSNKHNNVHLINKYTEYLLYSDILFFSWKLLPSLTAKTNPNETYIMNYLRLLEKLELRKPDEQQTLCGNETGDFFTFDESVPLRALNKVWHCVMLWEHSPQTHKQLLIVLLERALPHLEKPLFLTDFLMDSLDVGGPVSLLALQGIFTMIQVHNLNYPNIFAKLYSMFEPEIFHTKYKARLFYLSDLFLSSTHLPENLVAAFAKRLARLALIAPSEDVVIICMFIGNLILRHPGLKCLLNNPTEGTASSDPYIMEERDPVKSNAINSSLWELKSLQQHSIPSVATAARFINSPLPTIEWDLSRILDETGDDIFDKEVKKHGKLIALAFDKSHDQILHYWNI